jgi:fission process protein 1
MSPGSICGNPFFQASNTNNKSNTATMSDDKNKNTKTIDFEDIPRERSDQPRPDFSKPLPRKRLPAALQDTLDNEEKLWETMYEGHAEESTESNVRYAAYATRVRTILMSAHRYVAYTSDIGESFRPIAHPYLVKGAYGISWAYLIGDVSHEGYKAYLRNQRVLNGESSTIEDTSVAATEKPAAAVASAIAGTTPGKVPLIEDYRTVMAQRAIFQGVASMGLPAFTIHSIVKYAGRALKNNKNVKLRTWGPIGVSTRSFSHRIHIV